MFCSKCRKEINEGSKFCKYCGAETTEGFLSAKPVDSFLDQTNYSRLILNKYVAILVAVIFVVWVFAAYDSSYSGGTKTPLPPPSTQDSVDLPALVPLAPPVSLANGTVLKKSTVYLNGYGEVQIQNGTDQDAVAKLIHGGTSVLTVYIKANNTYTMRDISDGVYWLVFVQGLDWDSTTQKFRRDAQYSAFDETFNFVTTEDSQYYHYSTFEITLNPVVGGTAETSSVDPQQFDAY